MAKSSAAVDQDWIAAVDEKERQLGRPFPIEIKRLFRAVTPESFKAAFTSESVRVLELREIEWVGTEELGHFQVDSAGEQLDHFGFAAGIFGDVICVQCKSERAGAVVLLDHEGGDYLYLAQDLAEWLERLLKFNGTEYGYMAGEIENLDPGLQFEIRSFYRAMNPELKW
jgi:hypothetical protein